MVHETATATVQFPKAEGLGNETVNVDGYTSTETFASDKRVTRGSNGGSRKHTQQLIEGSVANLRNWWKAVHEVYKEDTEIWGFGSSAIFTVYEGPGGKVEKVTIDENEIQRRQGVEPLLPGLASDASKTHAEQKILLARSIAKDLEMGKRSAKSHSTIFSVVKHVGKEDNATARQKLVNQVDLAVHKAAPIVRSAFMFVIPIYGIFMLYGAYLVTKQSEDNIINEEKSAARLEKLRKLKAQITTRNRDPGTVQSPLAPSDFMQKILEVREMARQVRLEEGLQNSGQDLSSADEHNTKVKNLIDTAMVEGEEGTEQGEAELQEEGILTESAVSKEAGNIPQVKLHQDIIDVQKLEDTSDTADINNVSTIDSMHATKLENDGIGAAAKVKPRIIMSLDEAMAIIGRKQDLSSDKLYTDSEGVAERTLNGRKPQVKIESQNAGNSHQNDLDVNGRLSGLNGFRQDLISNGSERSNPIRTPKFGEHGRPGDKPNNMSFEAEMPHSEAYERPHMVHRGTLDELTLQGQLTEEQTLEAEGPASSHFFEETSGDDTPSQVNLHATNDYKTASDHTFSKVLPSLHLKESASEKSILNLETTDVVGSGQPLRERETFTNTKRWSKELQRKYDLERDPEARELMKEIGSGLDTWVSEAEVEEAWRLASKIEGGDEDAVHKHYERVQKKIKEERERFGLEAIIAKYKEYQSKPEDELWWLDLRCVLCLTVVSDEQEGEGLYGLDMSIDFQGTDNEVARHVVAFEDRTDASNFCHLLEFRSSSRFQFVQVCPFSPKELYKNAKEEGFKVTVIRKGQLQTNVDHSLEEVEDQILEIGRSVYWEKLDRERSIDIDSILHERFGL